MQDRRLDRHRSRREHVHYFEVCGWCGGPVDCYCYSGGGRQKRYCSDSHRVEAWRDRQKVARREVGA